MHAGADRSRRGVSSSRVNGGLRVPLWSRWTGCDRTTSGSPRRLSSRTSRCVRGAAVSEKLQRYLHPRDAASFYKLGNDLEFFPPSFFCIFPLVAMRYSSTTHLGARSATKRGGHNPFWLIFPFPWDYGSFFSLDSRLFVLAEGRTVPPRLGPAVPDPLLISPRSPPSLSAEPLCSFSSQRVLVPLSPVCSALTACLLWSFPGAFGFLLFLSGLACDGWGGGSVSVGRCRRPGYGLPGGVAVGERCGRPSEP